MKSLHLFGLALAVIGFASCKQNQEPQTVKPVAPVENISTTDCYTAVYESDTVALQMNTLENGKIAGNMTMRLENMPVKEGKIAGEFRGDTLFADYTFTQGANKQVTFRNPMAFLKKGEQLVLGNGQIETTLGASHFVKGKPIDFERVKYKFAKTACGN